MTKREILEDFIVFSLIQYDELNSSLGYFYNQENASLVFKVKEKLNYRDYIRQELILDDIQINENEATTLKRLKDIVSGEEVKKLITYLNGNFTQGFSDSIDIDDNLSNGTYPLYITESELEEDFQEYLSYHEINPKIYVSLLYQVFSQNYVDLKSRKENQEILTVSNVLFDQLKQDYLDDRLLKSKKKLFKNLQKYPFQLEGFVDEKGVYIDFQTSMKRWMITSKTFKVSNEVFMPPAVGSHYLMYQHLLFAIYGESFFPKESTSHQKLNIKFQRLLEDNSGLVQYLYSKSFSNEEIKRIINLLAENEFTPIKIRTMNFNQVELFRSYYLFYILDYFKEERGIDFSSEKDFEVLNFSSRSKDLKYRNNQFKKYYSNLHSNPSNKHYPFRIVNSTIEKIEKSLLISKGKLKQLPNSNFE